MGKNSFKKRDLLPPILVLVSNLAVSFLTRPFIDADGATGLACAADKKLPFLPGFIYIYVLAFLQWAVCILAVMVKDRDKSRYYCTGIIAGNIISGIIFVAFPTIMTIRPEYGEAGLTGFLVRLIFSLDNPPLNIFPSIHCLFSWACMRMVFALEKAPVAVKAANAVFSFLVFLSVLFVKQHVIYDVFAGILAFELGLFAVRLFDSKIKRRN